MVGRRPMLSGVGVPQIVVVICSWIASSSVAQ
jgi:hypothetical protein